MEFKKTALSAAVGAAIAGLAGHAFALAPSAFDPTTAQEVWISGASAQDEGVKAAMARICADGTLDLYQVDSNNRAFFCSAIPSLWPGLGKANVVVYKTSTGGSGNGVTPLLGSGQTLSLFMSMGQIKSSSLCTTVTTVVPSVTVAGDPRGVPSYNLRSCSAPTTNPHIPSGGLSDVEPRLFTNSDTSLLASASANSLIFGFAVNEKLYRALQAMEGKDSASTAADTTLSSTFTGTATSVAIRDNETNMPSLSKETLTAIFEGNLTSWSLLRGPSGATIAPSGSADMNVYVARRVPSSGTQKATEMFLLGGVNPTDSSTLVKCNPTTPVMVSSNSTGAADTASVVCVTPGTQTVFQGSGTGDVRNCLAFHDTASRYAIGLISTETPYSSADGNNEVGKTLRFIKIDGQSPSMINVATGRYKHWVEQSLNKPAYFASLGAGEQAGVNGLFNQMGGAPGITAALNATFNHRWGQGTLLSLALSGATATDPGSVGGLTQVSMISNPVNTYSKSGTGSPDSCLPAQFVGGALTPAVGAQENP